MLATVAKAELDQQPHRTQAARTMAEWKCDLLWSWQSVLHGLINEPPPTDTAMAARIREAQGWSLDGIEREVDAAIADPRRQFDGWQQWLAELRASVARVRAEWEKAK